MNIITPCLSSPNSTEVEGAKKNELNQEMKGLNIDNLPISSAKVSEESTSLIERTIITLSDSPIGLNVELSSSKEEKLLFNNAPLNFSNKVVNTFSKNDLLKKIGAEERHGLKYISIKELNKIVSIQHNENIPDLSTKIKNGEWDELLNRYGCKKETPYLILASFCQERITLEELSTALIFCRAFRNFKETEKVVFISEDEKPEIEIENVKVVRFGPDYYSLLESDGFKKSNSEIERSLSELNANQHFVLLVRLDAFDYYTRGLIIGTFKRTKVLGVDQYECGSEGTFLGIASFGLAKKFYLEFVKESHCYSEQLLTPALGLTPTLKEMGSNLLQGLSDVAILTPGHLPLVHGSSNAIWAYIHDLFHANARARLGKEGTNLIRLAIMISDIEKSDYLHKIHYDYAMLNPEFKIAPTRDEVVSYVIDIICSDLVDGAWPPPPHLTEREFLETVLIKIIVQKVMTPLNDKFHLQFDESWLRMQVIKSLEQVWDKYTEEMKLNG